MLGSQSGQKNNLARIKLIEKVNCFGGRAVIHLRQSKLAQFRMPVLAGGDNPVCWVAQLVSTLNPLCLFSNLAMSACHCWSCVRLASAWPGALKGQEHISPGQRPPRPPPWVNRHHHQSPIFQSCAGPASTNFEKREVFIFGALTHGWVSPGWYNVIPTGLWSPSARVCCGIISFTLEA